MSGTTLSTTGPLESHSSSAKAFWIPVIAQIAFGIIGAMTTWAVAFVPVLALVGCVALFWPRVGIFLLTASVFLRIEIPGIIGVYPGDIIALLLVGGLTFHLVFNGTRQLRVNPLVLPLIVLLVVFASSLLSAYDPALGLKNWFRHLQMVVVILVVAEVVGSTDIRGILRLVLWISVVLSIPNIIEAIRVGGTQRVFGIASLFFPFYLATAIMYCCLGYLLHEQLWKRRLLVALAAVMGLGIIASQTREAMVHTGIGVFLSCGLVWWWARRMRSSIIKRRVVALTLGSILAILIFLSGSISSFEAPANRVFQAVEGHSNTIFIRLFLWKTGIHVFLDSPVRGIGLGQNSEWDKFLPLWRFDPMAPVSRGLGVHNDLITYAAETGLLGLAAIFWFFARVVKVGWRGCHWAKDRTSFHLLLSVWVPCLAAFARFFFGTHTFYSLGGIFNCLYFGMLIACVRQLGGLGAVESGWIHRRAD